MVTEIWDRMPHWGSNWVIPILLLSDLSTDRLFDQGLYFSRNKKRNHVGQRTMFWYLPSWMWTAPLVVIE